MKMTMNRSNSKRRSRLFLTWLFCFSILQGWASVAPTPHDRYSIGQFDLDVLSWDPALEMGEAMLYIPFLGQRLPAILEKTQFKPDGSILSGLVRITSSMKATDLEYPGSAKAFLHEAAIHSSLPILMNGLPSMGEFYFGDQSMVLTDLTLDQFGVWADVSYIVETPEMQFLNFKADHVAVNVDGIRSCDLKMALELTTGLMDFELPLVIKGASGAGDKEASYVLFSCDGFEKYQLSAEYHFPKSQLTPVDATKESVVARFALEGSTWGGFIASASIDKFKIKGAEGVDFQIESAIIDYSTSANPDEFPVGIFPEYADVTWKGFFLKKATVSLPEGFAAKDGKRFSISMSNFLYTRGDGMSGSLESTPGLSGDIEGWGLSLDTVLLALVKNSAEIALKGKLAIPIMVDTLDYQASITYSDANDSGKKEMVMSLSIALAGDHRFPMLGDLALIHLAKDATAGVRYAADANGFEPFANLSGSIKVKLPAPAIDLPGLDFEDFIINDENMTRSGQIGKTGGLDRISIGTFSFGGLDFDYGQKNDENGADGYTMGAGTSKVSRFPIGISNIQFKSKLSGEKTIYGIDLTIDLNLMAGKNALAASGALTIWAGVDFAKVFTPTPWKALDYQETELDGLTVEGTVGGKITLGGGLSFIEHDDVYGDGFKGKITIAIPQIVTTEAWAQFGTTSDNNGDEDFPYFFVDMLVSVNPGLPMGTTSPMYLYGIGGGFFYNMTQGAVPDLGNPGQGGSPDEMNFFTPGSTMSGSIYSPRKGKLAFNAKVIKGLQVPEALLMDVTLGMFIDYEHLRIDSIKLSGSAFILSPGILDRYEAAFVVCAGLRLDPSEWVIRGQLGGELAFPKEDPFVTGSFNSRCSSDNLGLNLNNGQWYMAMGKPPLNSRMDVTMTLPESDLTLGVASTYFFAGNNQSELGSLPLITDVVPEINSLIGSNRSNAESVSRNSFAPDPVMDNRTGQLRTQFGLGMKLTIPERDYEFLSLYASFYAAMGFDALISDMSGCRTDPFGLNSWYAEAQAYAYAEGKFGMKLKWFGSNKKVNIGQVKAGLVAEAKLPNPSYFKGTISGRYNVLKGTVQGDFHFKFKTGKKLQCEGDSEFGDALADFPIIQDVYPKEGEKIEVYEGPSVTFLPQMDFVIEVDMLKDNGKSETHSFKCQVKSVTLNKGNQTIYLAQSFSENNHKLSLLPTSLLESNQTYTFTIVVGWAEINENGTIESMAYEESRTVTFTTGERPDKIVPQIVGYQSPGLGQKYWYKGYALPMLEFAQTGAEYLFPENKSYSFVVSDPSFANALVAANPGSSYANGSSTWSITSPVKYQIRVTDVATGSVQIQDIGTMPGDHEFCEWNYQPRFKFVNDCHQGIRLEYSNLTNCELLNGHVYSLEIVRVPAMMIKLPVQTISAEVDLVYASTGENDESMALESATYTELTMQRMDGDVPKIETEVLYEFKFGISQYDDFYVKFASCQFDARFQLGIPSNVFVTPDILLEPRPVSSYNAQTIFARCGSCGEGFDQFDQDRLKSRIFTRSALWSSDNLIAKKLITVQSPVYYDKVRDYFPKLYFDSQDDQVVKSSSVDIQTNTGIRLVTKTRTVTGDFPCWIQKTRTITYGFRTSTETYSELGKCPFEGIETYSEWETYTYQTTVEHIDLHQLANWKSQFTDKVWRNTTDPPYDWAYDIVLNTNLPGVLNAGEISSGIVAAGGAMPGTYGVPGLGSGSGLFYFKSDWERHLSQEFWLGNDIAKQTWADKSKVKNSDKDGDKWRAIQNWKEDDAGFRPGLTGYTFKLSFQFLGANIEPEYSNSPEESFTREITRELTH